MLDAGEPQVERGGKRGGRKRITGGGVEVGEKALNMKGFQDVNHGMPKEGRHLVKQFFLGKWGRKRSEGKKGGKKESEPGKKKRSEDTRETNGRRDMTGSLRI